MPNINLIAQKRQEKQALERNIRRLFFIMSGLFIVSILLFVALSAQVFRIKGRVNDLDQELIKLEPTIKQINHIDAQTADLGPKIQLYSKAREHTMRWYTYLQVVARSLPENTWLIRISPAPVAPQSADPSKAENAVVNLAGVTLSQKLVGETMLSLNRYRDLFDKVDLHYTQKGQIGGTPTVEFEVATGIRGLPSIFAGAPPAKTGSDPAKSASAAGGANENQTKS